MRATNLQELVYKNGQAGVTKASVSITFDNRNKKQSPLGYDQYDEIVITRQVIIGGKNKYMINGANIQANRVADFFRSVQLNVNNPHFLIMQGRITKVLNMKPPEVRRYWILFYYGIHSFFFKLKLVWLVPYYSIVKDSSADLGVNFKIVQNRPTVKAVCTKISKILFCIFVNIFIFLRENKEVSFFIFWKFKLKQP